MAQVFGPDSDAITAVRVHRPLLLSVALAATLTFPATAPAGTDDGGVQVLDQPSLGAVGDSDSGGGATTGGPDSGGPSVDDRPGRRARRRAVRRRRRALERRRNHGRAERRQRRESGGLSLGDAPTPPRVPEPEPVPVAGEDGHFFPVAGAFDLGGKDARFGASRPGHVHQGQDIAAAEGTPVVAPFAGTVEWVRYQRRGAGWYIVLDGAGEDRDYVFMHLRRGSLRATIGQRVKSGARLAEVGNTGASSGPHLHFEIWVGGWYQKGGRPIDPLPLLQAWL
ncbi:MAG TPA: M23 family metallopeptidase [Thermoleophilaceae bacterium]|nr:M23 family metallopeptidase [Thermoleophilaceae bacterium]